MADTIPEAAMVTAPVLHEKKGETPSNATHALDKESRSSLAETKFELTPEERKREWVQIAALCYALFFVGWVDGTTGPLLPAFQRHWGVNDTVVSLLFIFNCVVGRDLAPRFSCSFLLVGRSLWCCFPHQIHNKYRVWQSERHERGPVE
jgi:hypothetical protein